MNELVSIGDPALPPPTPEDLKKVRLVRRWSSLPPPHPEVLQLWHFWPALRDLPLASCLPAVRSAHVYLLGTFERRKAQWWQIQAQQHGLVLEIEEEGECES